MREKLRMEFEDKSWTGRRGKAPRSGPGSTLPNTARLRAALPGIFQRYKVKNFLDAPCGDWFWMQHVDLSGIQYTGADISKSLIAQNRAAFSGPNVTFTHLDITSDALPRADMMMCRECLFHLKNWLRWAFFENFVSSGIPYLLTTVDHIGTNRRLARNAAYTPFNPMLAPFNFPKPIELIPETADRLPTGKALLADPAKSHRSSAIWRNDQIAAVLAAKSNPDPAGEGVKPQAPETVNPKAAIPAGTRTLQP